ncbi:Arc family DNA-binding protein [Xanthomonas arboricola]|uniref:Arc family DNA-binding protein n=1 Tax=Xanthomonas arboricola TaxID=56448 RepID=UPI003EBD020F
MTFTSRNSAQIQLRIPSDLRELVKESAAAKGRSMNSEIVYRLLQSFGIEESEVSDDQGATQFKMRLPDELRDAISALADSNNRSISAQIIHMLEECVARQGGEP